ncbi:hypothetical protein IWX47DRAFT_684850 [Phyllosticta citricarpa]
MCLTRMCAHCLVRSSWIRLGISFNRTPDLSGAQSHICVARRYSSWLEGRNQRAPARNRIVVCKGSHVTTNSDHILPTVLYISLSGRLQHLQKTSKGDSPSMEQTSAVLAAPRGLPPIIIATSRERRSAAAATPEEQSSATTTTLESALSNWTQITLDVICVALSRANSLWISAARSDDPTTEELDEILVQNISTSIVSVASAVSAGPSPLDKTSAGSNTSRDLTLAKEVPKSLSGDKDVPPAWLTPLQLSDASDSWANPLLPTDEESVICPSAPPSSGPAASRPLACARCSTCSGSTNVHVTSCYRDIISSPSGKRQGLIRSGDDLLLSTSWASSASEIGRNNCHEALER